MTSIEGKYHVQRHTIMFTLMPSQLLAIAIALALSPLVMISSVNID